MKLDKDIEEEDMKRRINMERSRVGTKKVLTG